MIEDLLSAASQAIGASALEQVLTPINTLMRLPHLLLAEPRGGAGPRKRAKRNKRTLAMFDKFEAGELEDDPEEHLPSELHGKKQMLEEARLAGRIQQAAGAGSISVAARRLEDAKPADTTDPAVIAALERLHPADDDPEPLECDSPPLQIDAQALRRVLARVSQHYRSRAGGPSGWTFEMLLAVTSTRKGLDAALGMVNLILSGELPRGGGLLDSLLLALEKDKGGVRPIAIGEVWYRVAAMCAIDEVGKEAGRGLAPLQVGVGVEGGTEAVVHGLATAMAADPHSIVLVADNKNAFNEILRMPAIRQVKEHAPSLLPLVQFAYGAASALHVVGAPGTVLSSRRGVRQGDPLGPLLFALGFHSVLSRIAEEVPEAPSISYLDDFHAVGRGPGIRKVLGRLQGDGPGSLRSIGLTLVPRKSGVYTASTDAADLEECRQIQAATGVVHRTDGVTLVGTPVGTDSFVRDQLAARSAKVCGLVNKLVNLPGPLTKQCQFQVLRQSLGARMVHLQRTMRWSLLRDSTEAAEGAVVDAVAGLFNMPRGEDGRTRPGQELEQLTLPMRHGGFGLRKTEPLEASAARLSGVGVAQRVLADAPAVFRPLDGPHAANYQILWSKLRHLVPEVVEDCGGDATSDLGSQAARDELPLLQHRVARALADRAGKELLERQELRTEEGRRTAARLRSCSGAAASAWLMANPTSRFTTMGDHAFSMAGRSRLGLPAYAPVETPPCRCSGDNVSKGDHPLACTQNAKMTTMRHDDVIDGLRHVTSCASVCSSKEPPYRQLTWEQQQAGKAKGHRADILSILPGGKHVMVDVTVIHPLGSQQVGRACKTTAAAAVAAEKRKESQWEEFADRPQYEFVPFALESYGALGPQAVEYVKELGSVASASGRVPKSVFVMNAYKILSCALQKGNARMYAMSLTAVARSVGEHFVPGFDVPVVDG